jgi:hypothetical protein
MAFAVQLPIPSGTEAGSYATFMYGLKPVPFTLRSVPFTLKPILFTGQWLRPIRRG